MTTQNVFVANFFFVAAFGLVVSAQWELAAGNGFAYTVFSAFGEQRTPLFDGAGSQLTEEQGCSTPGLQLC